MDLEATWVTIVIVGTWLVVLSRLPTIFRRPPNQSATTRFILQIGWTALIGLCIVVPLYHPWIRNWLAVTGWLGAVPRAAAAIVVIVVVSRFCFQVAPAVRPRQDWPLWAGMLAIGAYVGSAWMLSISLPGGLTPARRQIPDQFFNLYTIFAGLRVIIPAHQWILRQEPQRVLRLRLQAMIWLWFLFAMWALVGVVEAVATLVDIRFDFRPVYAFLGMTELMAFVVYFLPGRGLSRLLELFDYAGDLLTLAIIWLLECRVARAIGRRRRPLTVSEVIRSPGEATYLCVIAILDSRKLLLQDAGASPGWLCRQLDSVARPELDYPQVVARLRKIGLADMQRSALRF